MTNDETARVITSAWKAADSPYRAPQPVEIGSIRGGVPVTSLHPASMKHFQVRQMAGSLGTPTRPTKRHLSASFESCKLPATCLVELTKPRLCALTVITAVIGYAAAFPTWNFGEAAAMLFGTAFAAAGALALNQWWERGSDGRMERTRGRPIPSGRISAASALAWGLMLSVGGVGLLMIGTKPLAAFIAAMTILLYVTVYTPLKRRTRWATEIGAIPGALPPLLGWAAAENQLPPLAWLLFAVVFFWQMPHFFAIGWMHRDEYSRAGFPLLPIIDAAGGRTAAWSLAHTITLALLSMLPLIAGAAGLVYGITAILCNAVLLRLAWRFFAEPASRNANARRLFRGTLLYLPLFLAGFLIDRLG